MTPAGFWRRTWPWTLGLLTLAVVLLILATAEGRMASSSLSRGSDGLWLARSYLEARGNETLLLDGPVEEWVSGSTADLPTAVEASPTPEDTLPDDTPPDDALPQGAASLPGAGQSSPVLVLAFPLERPFDRADLEAVRSFLQARGTVLVLYDNPGKSPLELQVLSSLGLEEFLVLRQRPPLSPVDWWRHRTEEWPLVGAPGSLDPGSAAASGEEDMELLVAAFQTAPTAPSDRQAQPLFVIPRGIDIGGSPGTANSAGGTPLAFRYPHQRGQVIVLPVRAWHNSQLQKAGNADLLESLASDLAGTWVFDEYHHGHIRPELITTTASSYAWDLLTLHLGLLYALTLLALGRRFGPPWSAPPRQQGSTAAFLRSLGQLHHRLGHHADAARLLVERMRQLDPRAIPEPSDSDFPDADSVSTAEELVRLGQAYSTARVGSPPTRPEDPRRARTSRP